MNLKDLQDKRKITAEQLQEQKLEIISYIKNSTLTGAELLKYAECNDDKAAFSGFYESMYESIIKIISDREEKSR